MERAHTVQVHARQEQTHSRSRMRVHYNSECDGAREEEQGHTCLSVLMLRHMHVTSLTSSPGLLIRFSLYFYSIPTEIIRKKNN